MRIIGDLELRGVNQGKTIQHNTMHILLISLISSKLYILTRVTPVKLPKWKQWEKMEIEKEENKEKKPWSNNLFNTKNIYVFKLKYTSNHEYNKFLYT